MPIESTAKVFNALYPEELLEGYKAGERNFAKINLLREELEHILGPTASTDLVEPMYTWLDKCNPLWADFHNPIDRRFEWDAYGAFIPVEYDDLLPDRNLSGANLSNVNLEGSYLYPVDFSDANLNRANLRNAILLNVNLSGADLSYADLRHAIVWDGNLQGANLYMARLERCILNECDLREADLRRAKLRKANMTGVDLRKANLSKAHFDETALNGATLQDIDFHDVDLNSVYVTGVTINASQQLEFLKALRVDLH